MGFFVVHGVRVYFQIRVFFILSILRIKNVDDILKEIIVNLEIYSYPMNHKEQSQEKEWRHSNGATWLLPYAFYLAILVIEYVPRTENDWKEQLEGATGRRIDDGTYYDKRQQPPRRSTNLRRDTLSTI